MKRIIAAALCFVLIFGLCGCEISRDNGIGDEIYLNVKNAVGDNVTSVSVGWLSDGVSKGSVTSESPMGKELGEVTVKLHLNRDDVTEDELKNVTFKVDVTELDGDTYTLDVKGLKPKFGKEYNYSLIFKGGEYKLKK